MLLREGCSLSRLYWVSILLFIISSIATASSSDFDIRLAHGSPNEKKAEKQLKRLLDTYDVSPYTFTYSIRIDQNDAPHSHPILTLNDYFLDDDASALSTFIHEQYHWLAIAFEQETNAAIEDLKLLYPQIPNSRNGGARSEYSTYAHLIVGLQEYHATASLFGKDEAKRVLSSKTWYTWIYKKVIEDEKKLIPILERHGLINQEY